jgi:Caspase domain
MHLWWGIDHYQNPRWPALANGKSDAMAAIAFLKSQNYQVTALLDQEATRANILGYFRAYLRERLKGNERFLFFFNGHGYTEKYGEKDIGYIVPVDGDSWPSLISMDEIREESALLQGAKHQQRWTLACGDREGKL